MKILATEAVKTSALRDLLMYTRFIVILFPSSIYWISRLILKGTYESAGIKMKTMNILKGIIAVVVISFAAFALSRGINTYSHSVHEVNEYKVTIDDTVTFNEIMDNYDVIEIDGDLIILRDKQ